MDEFKKLYISEIVEGNGIMSPELIALFDDVLANDFGGDHTKMDDLINSILPTPANEIDEAQKRIDTIESALLEIADMILTR